MNGKSVCAPRHSAFSWGQLDSRSNVLLQLLPVGVFQNGPVCLGFSAHLGFTKLSVASFRQGYL